ncbi:hypothetical protein FJT64_012645 [Amphibalanus amphitrite]|uniref:Gustatory receptor n=1 Tax=Amphibalanus amphitrite TaxID=1232801 RepID=A0A6A4UYU2_AMPAM|nr:hypothetical protein FJT64_012645 [Amphibalanus amphitrite]
MSRSTPVSVRCFLCLLRVCALTGGTSGWSDLLHVSFAVILGTAVAAIVVLVNFTAGMKELSQEKSPVEALAISAFFGLMFLLMWINLMLCYVLSRRRVGSLLCRIGRTLDEMADMPGYEESVQLLHREVAWLMVTTLVMTVVTVVVASYMTYTFDCTTTMRCFVLQTYAVAFDVFHVSFVLNILKFAYIGLHVNCGFRIINTSLEDFLNKESLLQEHKVLDGLMRIQDDLAQLFTDTTKVMSYEIISVMTCGAVASVSMWLILIIKISTNDLSNIWPMLILYTFGGFIAIVVPSELIHHLLTTLARSRDLLLVGARRRPKLGYQLSVFRETVGRDLDTLGDLGLFRLRRSTILSATATIVTYIIVMVQFRYS